jgi:hypothetical protein
VRASPGDADAPKAPERLASGGDQESGEGTEAPKATPTNQESHHNRETAQDDATEDVNAGSEGNATGEHGPLGEPPVPVERTRHGDERLREQGFDDGDVARIRETGRTYVQRDGATAYVAPSETRAERFDLLIEGRDGIVTAHRDLRQKSIDRLARNYGWDEE